MRWRRASAAMLSLATVTGAALGTPAEGASGARTAPGTNTVTTPNIVLITVDDLGYDQTSMNDGEIETPNIDRIAEEGVRFSDGYVASPVCTASRQALVTGRHPSRHGGHSNRLARDHPERLPGPTIGNLLKDRGYTTHAVGKWDLSGWPDRWGEPNVTMPHKAGFDGFYGSLRGMERYCAGQGTVWRDAGGGSYESFPNSRYMTHEYTENAERFLHDHRDDDDPFFLYMSYTAPHAPIQSPSTCPDKDVSAPTFREMVQDLDDGVGTLLDALGDEADNTAVVFVSDHGSQFEHFFPTQLRDGKYSLFEGGVRVPFAMRWPEGLANAPRTYSPMVSTLDLLPTIAGATGKGVQGYPGRDLVPYLNGERSGVPHDRLHWRYVDDDPNAQGRVTVAMRSDNYKYLRQAGLDGGAREYLFDLEKDIGETQNLADDPDYAQVRDRLVTEHNDWNRHNALNEDFEHVRGGNQPRRDKPDGFIEHDGDWTVVDADGDRQYRGMPDGAAGRVMFEGGFFQDASVATDVRLADRGHAGLLIRGSSAAAEPYEPTGYEVRLAAPSDPDQPEQIALYRVVDGEATKVRAGALSIGPGVTHRLRVDVVDDAVTVFLNEQLQFRWTDSEPLRGGGLGLTAAGTTVFFDDMEAKRKA